MAAAPQSKPMSSMSLPGADRVAAILLTMGNTLASRLMKHFDPDEIKLITRSAADLKPVPTAMLRSLIEDFATQFAAGANLVGTAGEVERMLTGVLPQEQVDEIMGDILGNPDRSIWERVSAINESVLASYISNEHPQTAALILSKVKPACAAKVIGYLPANSRDGIIRRMLTVKPIVDESLRLLEHTLQQEFTMNFSRNAEADGHARIAEIINKLDRSQMDEVLTSLASTRPKEAESLKGLLFTFDDIAKLAPRARTSLLDKVPSDRVVMALRGTATEFRELILSSLSSRVRKMIEQELNSGQPVPQREVTEARRVVTDMALDMASRGEIEIRGQGEDAYVS